MQHVKWVISIEEPQKPKNSIFVVFASVCRLFTVYVFEMINLREFSGVENYSFLSFDCSFLSTAFHLYCLWLNIMSLWIFLRITVFLCDILFLLAFISLKIPVKQTCCSAFGFSFTARLLSRATMMKILRPSQNHQGKGDDKDTWLMYLFFIWATFR